MAGPYWLGASCVPLGSDVRDDAARAEARRDARDAAGAVRVVVAVRTVDRVTVEREADERRVLGGVKRADQADGRCVLVVLAAGRRMPVAGIEAAALEDPGGLVPDALVVVAARVARTVDGAAVAHDRHVAEADVGERAGVR